MNAVRPILNLAVAAAILLAPTLSVAQEAVEEQHLKPPVADTETAADPGPGTAADRESGLLADLARPDNAGWRRVERQLLVEWARSGSAQMDLLLQRGREALREDDVPAALEHLTALTDHAPDFAEGWNQRAAAYFRAGQYGPAMLDLARAVSLNPRHFGALAGLGALLDETGNKTGAREVYQAVLAIHPNLATVRDALTRLDLELSGQKI